MSYFSLKRAKPGVRLWPVLLSSVLLVAAGCSDSGGGDEPNNSGGPSGGGTGGTPTTPTLSFNLSGAVSLIANEEAIVEDTAKSRSATDGQ